MRVLAFSDLHLDKDAARALLAKADDADLVIGAGDFAQRRDGLVDYMNLIAGFGRKAIYVPGNNESFAELQAATQAEVLHGGVTHRDGLTIAGIGGAIPPLPPLVWESYDISETQAAEILGVVQEADILISHSPPKGHCDQHAERGAIGSTAVLEAAVRIQPRYLLCGHVHDAWGERSQVGRTEVINLGPDGVWLDV